MKILLQFALTLALISCNQTNENSNQKMKIMGNENYSAKIIVNKDVTTAFEAIKNFRAWWSEDIEGNTDKLGETFFYHYKAVHLCKIKLIEVIADKKLVYQVIDNEFNFTKDKKEWINTKLIFELSPEGDKTKIVFTHEGLVPEYECYEICNEAWSNYIQKSLFDLISIGKGQPNPKDKEGFNAALADKWKLK